MKKRNPNNAEVRQRCLTTQLLHHPMMMTCEHCGTRNRYDVPTNSSSTKCRKCSHAAFLSKNKCDCRRCENAREALNVYDKTIEGRMDDLVTDLAARIIHDRQNPQS